MAEIGFGEIGFGEIWFSEIGFDEIWFVNSFCFIFDIDRLRCTLPLLVAHWKWHQKIMFCMFCCHFVNCGLYCDFIVGNYVSIMFANSIGVEPRVRLAVCLFVRCLSASGGCDLKIINITVGWFGPAIPSNNQWRISEWGPIPQTLPSLSHSSLPLPLLPSLLPYTLSLPSLSSPVSGVRGITPGKFLDFHIVVREFYTFWQGKFDSFYACFVSVTLKKVVTFGIIKMLRQRNFNISH